MIKHGIHLSPNESLSITLRVGGGQWVVGWVGGFSVWFVCVCVWSEVCGLWLVCGWEELVGGVWVVCVCGSVVCVEISNCAYG